MERRLLTRREAAAVLGVHPGTLDRWTRLGVVPAVRIGLRTVRYTAEALADALRPKRAGA